MLTDNEVERKVYEALSIMHRVDLQIPADMRCEYMQARLKVALFYEAVLKRVTEGEFDNA